MFVADDAEVTTNDTDTPSTLLDLRLCNPFLPSDHSEVAMYAKALMNWQVFRLYTHCVLVSVDSRLDTHCALSRFNVLCSLCAH